jgi:hypothetical protein
VNRFRARPEDRATGDAVDLAFRALVRHTGDCQHCAWLGDDCDERLALVQRFAVAMVDHSMAALDTAIAAMPGRAS